MVKRVSRAIRNDVMGHQGKQSQTWETISERARQDWLRTGKAAIAAMREPTQAMIEAGAQAGASWESETEDFRESWRAQIDQALK